MSSTVLALIQSYSREYGLPVPTALQGGDAGALQLREALTTCGEDMWGRAYWQRTARRATWTSIAGGDQGDINTLFPEAFASIVPRTFWNYSQNYEITGPVGDVNWQREKSLVPSGPLYYFRVANDRLEVTSSMPSGQSLSLIYKTRHWIVSGGSGVEQFVTDNDTMIFSDRVMKAGLRAYWLRLKQMPHSFEFQLYDDMAGAEASTDTVKPVLRLDYPEAGMRPMVGIPSGNWIVSP